MIGGILLLVVGVLVFGSGQFFKTTVPRVAFFTDSLAGLGEGAPVRFRGVKIGTVTKIVLDYNLKSLTMNTPVYFELDPSRFVVSGGELAPRDEKDRMAALIAKGLRAQLSFDSLVTGQQVVDLVMRPDTKVTIVADDTDVLQVPTIPSETAEIKNTVTAILDHLGKLDIVQINQGINNLLAGAGKLVGNPELDEIIHETKLAIPEVRQLVRNTDGEVESLANSLSGVAKKASGSLGRTDEAVDEARKAFVGAQGTLRKGDQVLDSANSLIKPGAQAHFQMIEMMEEVTAAARSVKSLANTLHRDPESVLFGRPKSGGR